MFQFGEIYDNFHMFFFSLFENIKLVQKFKIEIINVSENGRNYCVLGSHK